MVSQYNDPPKGKLDLKSEILALFDSLKCRYVVTNGLIVVTTPDNFIWGMTTPREQK